MKIDKPIISKLTVKHIDDEGYDCDNLQTEYEYGHDEDTGKPYLTIINSPAYSQKDVETEGIETVLGWIKEDHKRLEDYSYKWYSFGVVAEAEVKYKIEGGDGSWRLEWLKSGGLWGFESDNRDEPWEEEQYEQLMNLKEHLEHFGVDTKGFSNMLVEVLDVHGDPYYSVFGDVTAVKVKDLKPKAKKKAKATLNRKS